MFVIKLGKNLDINSRRECCFTRINLRVLPILLAFMTVLVMPVSAYGKVVAEWDFTKGTKGWTGNSRVEKLVSSPEGLLVKSTGQDPWIEGPAIDLPGEKKIKVKIRMKSNEDSLIPKEKGRCLHTAPF